MSNTQRLIHVSFLMGCILFFMYKSFPENLKLFNRGFSSVNESDRNKEPKQSRNSNPVKCLQKDFLHPKEADAQSLPFRQVYITFPAKAGGSSLKRFASICSKSNIPDNVLNAKNGKRASRLKNDFFASSLDVPRVISSHMSNDQVMIRLIETATTDSLIVYVLRDETDRLVSATKFVARSCLEEPNRHGLDTSKIFRNRSAAYCEIPEEYLMKLMSAGQKELGYSNYGLLSCDTFDAIEKSRPNMIFVKSSESDQLQEMLANAYCPEALNSTNPPFPLHVNEANTNIDVQIILSQQDERQVLNNTLDGSYKSLVGIEKWLAAKREVFEFVLMERPENQCVGRLRTVAAEIDRCPSNMLHFSSATDLFWN